MFDPLDPAGVLEGGSPLDSIMGGGESKSETLMPYAAILISEFLNGQDLDCNEKIYGRDFYVIDTIQQEEEGEEEPEFEVGESKEDKPISLESIEEHPEWEYPEGISTVECRESGLCKEESSSSQSDRSLSRCVPGVPGLPGTGGDEEVASWWPEEWEENDVTAIEWELLLEKWLESGGCSGKEEGGGIGDDLPNPLDPGGLL